MKKGLLFVTALSALGLGLAACGNSGGSGGGGKSYTVTITNKDSIAEIYDDDSSKSVSIAISDGIITADAFRSGDLVVTSSNESALIIQGNNKLKPVAAGETTVKAIYKNKFSDEVSIRVVARPAYRVASTLTEQGEYLLISPMASGKVYASAHMATGGARFYISGSENFDDAAAAKVLVGSEPEFKYTIKLKDPNTEEWKTLGTAANNNNGWHYNLGFVGDNVPDTQIAYTEAKFKLTDEKYLETVVTYDTNKTVNLYVGTGTGKTTISLGDTTKVTPAHLYEEGDAIPATAVTVTPATATVRPGLTQQLSAALTPSDSTDEVVWASDNKQVATVDAKGLVTAVSNGTATITATARVGVFGSATITVAGEAINYGTAENPLTPEQAVALLDTFGKGNLTTQKIFVRGVVTSSTAAGKNGRNVWISNTDGSVAEYFEGYSVKNTNVTLPTEANALVGGTITMTGWGTLFNTTYEITNKNASGSYDNGEIIAFEAGQAPDLQGIVVTPESATVDILNGATTKQFSVAPNPAAAAFESSEVSWSVSPADAGVTVSASGLVSVAADAVEEDATAEFTITASYSVNETVFTDSAVLTVTRDTAGGGAEKSWQKVTSAPADGSEYRLALDRENSASNPGYWYLKSEMSGYYVTTTDKVDEAATVTVTAVSGGYNVKLDSKYLSITNESSGVSVALTDSPVTLEFSLTFNIFGITVSSNFWGIGTRSDQNYTTAGRVNFTSYPTNYKVYLMEYKEIPALTGISLSQGTADVEQGGSLTLTASPVPSIATLGTVVWTSDNEKVTVVDGVVTVASDAVAGSTATITATVGTLSATCVITVIEAGSGPVYSDATMAKGTDAYDDVTVNGGAAIKIGTSNKGGTMTITVPAGAVELIVYAGAWKGVSGLSLNITGGTANPASIALTATDVFTGSNKAFTISDVSSFKFVIALSGIEAETTLTFTTSIAKRCVVWGAQYR